MERTELVKRLGVTAVVALVIVAGVGYAPAQIDSGEEPQPMDNSEYAVDDVAPEPIPARGQIRPNTSAVDGSGLVLIDNTHSNRFERQDIEPLVRALTRVGYNVQLLRKDNMEEDLDDADALVIIDPNTKYRRGDINDIKDFTDDGGRVLVLAEPDRKRISGGLFGVSISTAQSKVTELGAAYNVSVGTNYLYNLETNDGNYQYVTAGPSKRARFDGVNRVAMYTAAPIHSRTGRALLLTDENTRVAGTEASDRYVVALRKDEVVFVGDKTFLREGRHNVADNERFIEYLVEFLTRAYADDDRAPRPDGDGPGNETNGNETNGNETALTGPPLAG